jgi:hypothetical protein
MKFDLSGRLGSSIRLLNRQIRFSGLRPLLRRHAPQLA